MNTKKWTSAIALFVAVAIFNTSCQKDNKADHLGMGEGTVNIHLKGIGSNTNNEKGLRASTAVQRSARPAVQTQLITFGDYSIAATLSEVKDNSSKALRASANRAESTGEGALEPFDGAYKINVYQEGTLFKTIEVEAGNTEPKFTLPEGNYTVTTTAWGNESGVEGSADRDPLAAIGQTLTVSEDTDNTLDVVLQHQLSEVTVVFDASIAGNIESIAEGTVAPNQEYTFDEETGEVTFGDDLAAKSFGFAPASEQNGAIWTSNAALFATAGTTDGVIALNNISIGGTPGSVSKGGWNLQPGVQYTLDLHLIPKGAIEFPGSEDLDIFIGNANLTGGGGGNAATGIENNQYTVGETYVGKGSQGYCSVMGDGWMVPTIQNFTDLIAVGTVRGTYNGEDGWFFGTSETVAEADADKYLFLPFNESKYVNSGSGNNHLPEGARGAYWTAEDQGGGKTALVLYDDPNMAPAFVGIHQNDFLGIRCIRAK